MGKWLVSAPCEYPAWPVAYLVDDEEQPSSCVSPDESPVREDSDDDED